MYRGTDFSPKVAPIEVAPFKETRVAGSDKMVENLLQSKQGLVETQLLLTEYD